MTQHTRRLDPCVLAAVQQCIVMRGAVGRAWIRRPGLRCCHRRALAEGATGAVAHGANAGPAALLDPHHYPFVQAVAGQAEDGGCAVK